MDAPAPAAKPPGKVQAIGIMHLVGGILNVLMACFWLLYGLLTGVMTFGIGLFICCPAFIVGPIGVAEILSGIKHLSSNPQGLSAPRGIAIAEIASILGCSTLSMIFGILTLVFLSDPEVDAWYQSKQLTGV